MPTAQLLFEKPLPSSRGASASHEATREAAAALKGRRAMVVEDEGVTQVQLRRILRAHGLEVVATAGNGRDAVAKALAARPEIVLMDIRMPLMDGLEASRRILAEYRACIVMLTAFSDGEMQQEAAALGACGYVIKPVTADRLIPELVAALGRFGETTGEG